MFYSEFGQRRKDDLSSRPVIHYGKLNHGAEDERHACAHPHVNSFDIRHLNNAFVYNKQMRSNAPAAKTNEQQTLVWPM